MRSLFRVWIVLLGSVIILPYMHTIKVVIIGLDSKARRRSDKILNISPWYYLWEASIRIPNRVYWTILDSTKLDWYQGIWKVSELTK